MCVGARKPKRRPQDPRRSPKSAETPKDSTTHSTSPAKSSETVEEMKSPNAKGSPNKAVKNRRPIKMEVTPDIDYCIEALQRSNLDADPGALKIMVGKKKRPKQRVERHIGDVDFSLPRSTSLDELTKYERPPRRFRPNKSYDSDDTTPITNTTSQAPEEPDENNYMANLEDMEFICHELMYAMGGKKNVNPQLFQPADVYGPLQDLENNERYSWKGLRTNSFLTNTLTLPTHAEVECAATGVDTTQKIHWNLPAMDAFAFMTNTAKTYERTGTTVDRTCASISNLATQPTFTSKE